MRDDVKCKVEPSTLLEVRVKENIPPRYCFGDLRMRQAFFSQYYNCWFIKMGPCRALSCRNLESFEFHAKDIVERVGTPAIVIE